MRLRRTLVLCSTCSSKAGLLVHPAPGQPPPLLSSGAGLVFGGIPTRAFGAHLPLTRTCRHSGCGGVKATCSEVKTCEGREGLGEIKAAGSNLKNRAEGAKCTCKKFTRLNAM